MTATHDEIIDNIRNTKIAPSSIHGFGLFATQEIRPGSKLCDLDGQYMRYSQLVASWLYTQNDHPFLEWNALPKDMVLFRPLRTKYSFINHAKQPNCKIIGNPPQLWSISPIATGEELLLNYADEKLPKAYLSGHGSTFLNS